MEGIGATGFWGLSPALDLQEPIDTWAVEAGAALAQLEQSSQPMNILCVFNGDIRHVLKTMAQMWRHPKKNLHFYLADRKPEILARHLLLLSIIFDNTLSITDRVEIFLEIFGNSLLRERTEALVATKAQELIKFVTDDEGPLLGLVDLSLLRFKDRDALEDVFKSWRPGVKFDIKALREERLRAYYRERYDHRSNLADWDYAMKLCSNTGATVVHTLQYRDWRERGIAFEVRDSAYVRPNRTLASYATGRERGVSVARRGYWGDIVTSPYIAFGVTCEDTGMFRRASDQHVKHTQDIAERNLRAFLYEMEMRTRLPPGDSAADARATGTVPLPEGVRITLLLGDASPLYRKQRFAGIFQRAVLSAFAASTLGEDFGTLLAPDAVVTVETAQYIFDFRPEQKIEFLAKLGEAAARAALRIATPQLPHPHTTLPPAAGAEPTSPSPPPFVSFLHGFAGIALPHTERINFHPAAAPPLRRAPDEADQAAPAAAPAAAATAVSDAAGPAAAAVPSAEGAAASDELFGEHM